MPNIYFLVSVVCLMIADYMIYTDFTKNFSYICICIFLYTILSSLALKEYVFEIKIKWKNALSYPFIIASLLICYLIFSFSSLIIDVLPDSKLIISLPVTGLIIYYLVSYYLYVSDAYRYGIKLLVAIITCVAIVALTSMNQLYLQCDSCTLFIALGHILGIYIFMRFLVIQDPKDVQDVIKHDL